MEEGEEAEETEEEAEEEGEGEGRERPEEEDEALLPCKHHGVGKQGTDNAGHHWQSCKPAVFIGQGCCGDHPKESEQHAIQSVSSRFPVALFTTNNDSRWKRLLTEVMHCSPQPHNPQHKTTGGHRSWHHALTCCSIHGGRLGMASAYRTCSDTSSSPEMRWLSRLRHKGQAGRGKGVNIYSVVWEVNWRCRGLETGAVPGVPGAASGAPLPGAGIRAKPARVCCRGSRQNH